MYDLAHSQMAYYPFRPSDPLKDVTGNLGPLTASSYPPTTAPGPWSSSSAASFSQQGGTCLRLDSNATEVSPQYYKLPDLTFPSASLSVCLWYSPLYQLDYADLFDFGNGFNVDNINFGELSYSSHLITYLTGSGEETLLTLDIGGQWIPSHWTHVCITLEGTQLTVYTDSKPATFLLSAPVSVPRTRIHNYIGRASLTDDCLYVGSISEFRIFNRSLTSAEVSAIYGWKGDGTKPMVEVSCAATCTAGLTQ